MARCRLCNDLEKKDSYDPRLGFDFRPQELIRSASDQNCASCSVILSALHHFQTQGWSFLEDVRRVSVRCCTPLQNTYQSSLVMEVFFTDDRPKFEIELFTRDATSWRAILPRTPTSGHPLSPQGLTWVKSLIDTCSNTHALCNRLRSPRLPKRLLDIRPKADGTFSIRLLEAQEEFANYIALSHCWGKEQTCTTTSENLRAHMDDIPWKMIPKTFRDAMLFSSRLGIRYIWIDSLCIIQNDSDDWEVEASKMADVYSNSYLTLAATSSPGDSQGCFPDHQPSFVAAHSDISIPNTTGAQFAARKLVKHWHDLTPRMRTKHFPLLSRGWVFQERLLSPRVLHVCEMELVWECRECSICECGNVNGKSSPGKEYHIALKEKEQAQSSAPVPQASLDHLLAVQLQQEERDENEEERDENEEERDKNKEEQDKNEEEWDKNEEEMMLALTVEMSMQGEDGEKPDIGLEPSLTQAGAASFGVEHAGMNLSSIASHFHRLVEQYSALSLTKPTDMLPALSGISKRMSHLRGHYLAGLWADSFCFDLLWRVNTLSLHSPDSSRSHNYRLPSWSWIAAESGVAYWDSITNNRNFPKNHKSPAGDMTIAAALWCRANSLVPLCWNVDSIKVLLRRKGKNPFGEVDSAVLEAEASVTTATVYYSRHQPYKYLLHTGWNQRDEITFHADYVLMAVGSHFIQRKEQVAMLLVHPEVSLVLKERVVPRLGRVWERVGIARLSEDQMRVRKVDWMLGSEVQKLTII